MSRAFLSSMCLDEVLAGVAVFNDFYTDSFSLSSRSSKKKKKHLLVGYFPRSSSNMMALQMINITDIIQI